MKVNIGILGAGIFAKEAYIPALKFLLSASSSGSGKDLFHLSAVYSRSRSSASAIAALAQSQLGLETLPQIYFDVDDSDNNAAKADGLGLDKLLRDSDIQAVIIALPISLQPSIVVQALQNGKHVLSEKPVAPSVEKGLELIERYEHEFRPKGLIWRVAENWEAEPAYRRLAQITNGAGSPGVSSASVFNFGTNKDSTGTGKDVIKEKNIGNVKFFRLTAVNYVDLDGKWYKTPWRTIPDYQGGFLLDGGVHSAAIIRLFLSREAQPGQVSAHASLTREHLKPCDSISAVVGCSPESEKGATTNTTTMTHGIFELSFGAPCPSRSSAEKGGGGAILVTADKGWVRVENVRVGDKPKIKLTIHVVTQTQEHEGDEIAEEESVEIYEARGVEVEVYAFLKAVSKASESGNGNASVNDNDVGNAGEGYLGTLGSPREALRDVALIEACLTSHGRPVDVRRLVGGGKDSI